MTKDRTGHLGCYIATVGKLSIMTVTDPAQDL